MNEQKLISKIEAQKLIAKNQTALVTGSFDLMHLGHLRFLAKSKELVGKKGLLIVALLNDREVKQRKGNDRPIFNENYRLEFLSNIAVIDYVFLWEEPWKNLRNFVLESQPAFLVAAKGDKGLENKRKTVEKAGGKFVLIPKQGDYSSSSIIKSIKLSQS